jgi:hypothetical protein
MSINKKNKGRANMMDIDGIDDYEDEQVTMSVKLTRKRHTV